jgi:hypothetical protein
MESGAGIAQHQRPRFAYLHHISLPCRDVEESKRFYTQVLGGELIHDIPGFAEVRIADMIFGMSRRDGADRGVPALGAKCRREKLCAGPALARSLRGAAARLDAKLQNCASVGVIAKIFWRALPTGRTLARGLINGI